MSALKSACSRATAAPALPCPGDRIEVARVADRIANRGNTKARAMEIWARFLARIDLAAPHCLKPKDLKRLLEEMWLDEALDDEAADMLDHGVKRNRKSIDRTIISAYLRAFPVDHPAFDRLTHASAYVARRHDWLWRERGEKWQLWDVDAGPARLSRELLASDTPTQLLRDAGLDGDLATGGFVEEALLVACETAAREQGEGAQATGRRLIALFEGFPASQDLNAALTYALLAPWTTSNCSEAHQRLISGLLVSRNGDPRLAPQRWSALRQDVLALYPEARVEDAFAVLRHWLVRATVREFFSVVAKTVERRDQWKERTDFWLAYLDAGFITDAWFAFGPQAERLARKFMEGQKVEYATLEGGGATPKQSALIFTIGDMRIAEWSDNGKCRFWHGTDPRAPALYDRRYYGPALRAEATGQSLHEISHNPPNGWQLKFARHVYQNAGIRHPRHGAGW